MKNLLRDIRLIVLLAILWLVGGAVAGAGVRAYFYVDWVAPCSLFSLILRMSLLLGVMRDGDARRRLYGEADEEMPFRLSLAALTVVPVVLLFVGLLWLLTAPLLPK